MYYYDDDDDDDGDADTASCCADNDGAGDSDDAGGDDNDDDDDDDDEDNGDDNDDDDANVRQLYTSALAVSLVLFAVTTAGFGPIMLRTAVSISLRVACRMGVGCSRRREPALLPRLRARANWKRAVRQISIILRLRRRWAALGRFLQDERLHDLTFHLERKNGRLRRKTNHPPVA